MDASLKLSDENDIFMESLRMEGWILLLWSYIPDWASQVVQVIKNLFADAGNIKDPGLIPGSGRFPEDGVATHSSILAWRIPRTEEPGGLQSMGLQSRTQLKQVVMAWHTHEYQTHDMLTTKTNGIPPYLKWKLM